jgi:hypothetical protein
MHFHSRLFHGPSIVHRSRPMKAAAIVAAISVMSHHMAAADRACSEFCGAAHSRMKAGW